MPLILQPMFNDKTREEIEIYLMEVRARRLSAVATYYAGMNAKAIHAIAKEQERMQREYSMLRREIEKMEALEEAIEARLAKVVEHHRELGLYHSQLVEVEDGNEGRNRKKANGAGTWKEPERKPERSSVSGAIRSGRAPGV